MILAVWKNGCWELRDIPSRGRAPTIATKNAIVFSKKKDAIKELVLRRQQPVRMVMSPPAKQSTSCCEFKK